MGLLRFTLSLECQNNVEMLRLPPNPFRLTRIGLRLVVYLIYFGGLEEIRF